MMRKIILIIFFYLLCSVKISHAGSYVFNGEFDLDKETLDLQLNINSQNALVINAQKARNDSFRFLVKVDHLKALHFDWSSQIETVVEVLNKDNAASSTSSFAGHLRSQYSLIDYKPIKELSGAFEIKEDRLYLSSLSYGSIGCDGYIELSYPFKINLNLSLADIDMDDFLNFWIKDKQYDSKGLINGDIKISGPVNELSLKGRLNSFDGFIKNLQYDTIFLNISGIYPKMRIEESFLSKTDGLTFSFDGLFDLSDHKNFKKQIKDLNLSPLTSESKSQKEWTIKRHKNDDGTTTELKYLFRKNGEVGLNSDQGADMLGIQQTMEF